MGEDNRIWQPILWFTLDLPGDRHFTPRNSWELAIPLELKDRRNDNPTTGVSEWLVSLKINYLEVFLVMKTAFLKLLWKSLGNFSMRRIITVVSLRSRYCSDKNQRFWFKTIILIFLGELAKRVGSFWFIILLQFLFWDLNFSPNSKKQFFN